MPAGGRRGRGRGPLGPSGTRWGRGPGPTRLRAARRNHPARTGQAEIDSVASHPVETDVTPAHPVILRNLVKRYESLTAARTATGNPAVAQESDDVARLLCVATCTADIRAALVAARPGTGRGLLSY